jgi:hypothetical protein
MQAPKRARVRVRDRNMQDAACGMWMHVDLSTAHIIIGHAVGCFVHGVSIVRARAMLCNGLHVECFRTPSCADARRCETEAFHGHSKVIRTFEGLLGVQAQTTHSVYRATPE